MCEASLLVACERTVFGSFYLFLLTAVLALASAASRTRAHAPPEVQRIVWQGPGELVLVSNRGLMFAALDTRNFRLMCNEALHINNEERPGIAYRRDGGLIAATSNGLFESSDRGCSWQPVAPFGAAFVAALAQFPDDADHLIVATFAQNESALHVTRDGGRSFSLLKQLEGRDYTQSLLIAPGDTRLVYASGTTLIAGPPPRTVQYVARSEDGGANWERMEFTLQEGELNVQLLAINPMDGRELLARASSASPGVNPERVLWSRDGAKTFKSALMLPAITGASFAADGSAAWVSASTGLYRAGAARDAFTQSGEAERLTCVEAHGDELWTCGHFAGPSSLRDGVGRTRDLMGAAFESALEFNEITQPIACPDGSPTADKCRSPWLDFYAEVSRFAASDAGAPDAGGDATSAAAPAEPEEDEPDAALRSDDAGTSTGKRPHGCGVNGADARASLFDVVLLLGVVCARWVSRAGTRRW
jgi:hypothetical protein